MLKYIRENLYILSVTLGFSLFPNFVLATPSPGLEKIINQKIASMSIEEKVGQLFIVGFPQQTLTPELQKFITAYKPGSYLLFKRNIVSLEQIKALNASLYSASYRSTNLPPLIAIDQEGGAVSRLPISPAQPNALALGQTHSPQLAEDMGYQTGLFLREVGFNMNLAPVLDVANPQKFSFIGVRSFGSDPQVVSDMGFSYSKGLLKAHVIPTGKHFPGTGGLAVDPHHQVVQNSSSLESLESNDLVPFKSFAKLGYRTALMLSHSIYPALDESREPASFSKKINKDLLRGRYNYEGLVFTDDLQMQGSKQLLRIEVAALKALQAGSDVVMLTWSFKDQARAFDYVKEAVKKGELSQADLDEKLRRILRTKAFANTYRKVNATDTLVENDSLTSKAYVELESKILSKNIKTSLLPQRLPDKEDSSRAPASEPAPAGNVCVVAPQLAFIESFRAQYTEPFKSLTLADSMAATELRAWIAKSDCYAVVGAITGSKSARLLRGLPSSAKRKVIAVNLAAPNLVANDNSYSKVMQLYFNHKDSGRMIAEQLPEILKSTFQVFVTEHSEK